MKTTYRKVLSRRTLLRSAAGVVIGLPFIEEMSATSVYAQTAPVVRAFNVFFGLGYQKSLQDLGLSSSSLVPAEPLVDAFGSRLTYLRGIDQSEGNGEGNAHYDGSSVAFTGTPADRRNSSKSVTGGASMDQALRLHAYPNGLPPGVLNALNTGTWWRFSDSTQRYIHSRLDDGSPAGDNTPPQDPKELFDKLFQGLDPNPGPTNEPQPEPDSEAERARRMNASVLDGLMDQLDYYQGPRGGLSLASRARITSYFEQIRELERRVGEGNGELPQTDPTASCEIPTDPGGGWYGHRLDGDGSGIDITVEKVQREVRLMADLFALGVACDRVRFGSFVFQSGGERIRMEGRYDYNGRTITDFDDDETSHELWHDNDYDACALHLHFMMNQLAYFLQQLDAIVENGHSVFDTSMITISTESGNGQHSSGELRDVFHAINGANGVNKTGFSNFVDVAADGIDLYNTMLRGHGVPESGLLWDGQGDLASQILV